MAHPKSISKGLAAQKVLVPQIDKSVASADEFPRRWIAWSIIGLFIFLVVAVVVGYFATALCPSLSQLTSAADHIRELANTLVLPIVTLVLGYYFGKRAE